MQVRLSFGMPVPGTSGLPVAKRRRWEEKARKKKGKHKKHKKHKKKKLS
jgi:hypothetical protein